MSLQRRSTQCDSASRPATAKSSWSAGTQGLPGRMPRRRLKKLLTLSPAIADRPHTGPRICHGTSGPTRLPGQAHQAWTPATAVAAATASATPRQVLWLPSQRSLIGRAGPGQNRPRGGAMLAAYSGSIR